jgi:hypothetical protein
MKKTVFAAVMALGMSMSAQADLQTVGGVTWDPELGVDFESHGNIVEDQLDFGADGLWDGLSGNNDDVLTTLTGFGIITSVNNELDAANFCSGCELTFEFGGFEVAAIAGGGFGTGAAIAFTGGWVNFYVDYDNDFDFDNSATANDGTLWLALEAHEVFNAALGFDISLLANLTAFGPTVVDTGAGGGLLDVVLGAGGSAEELFDTNGETAGADLTFASSFGARNEVTAQGFELGGTADFFGTSTSVPEPSSLALLALGLLGFGFTARNKKAK